MGAIDELELLLYKASSRNRQSSDYSIFRIHQPENGQMFYRLTFYQPLREFVGPTFDQVIADASDFMKTLTQDIQG